VSIILTTATPTRLLTSTKGYIHAGLFSEDGSNVATTGKHRFVPRFVAADEIDPNAYSGCFPACVLMALIYWYVELKPNTWKVPTSVKSSEWVDIVRSSVNQRGIGGVEFGEEREKAVKPILESIGSQSDLTFESLLPASVLETARTLAHNEIPTGADIIQGERNPAVLAEDSVLALVGSGLGDKLFPADGFAPAGNVLRNAAVGEAVGDAPNILASIVVSGWSAWQQLNENSPGWYVY
jgi:hypothetical protein